MLLNVFIRDAMPIGRVGDTDECFDCDADACVCDVYECV